MVWRVIDVWDLRLDCFAALAMTVPSARLVCIASCFWIFKHLSPRVIASGGTPRGDPWFLQ